MTRRKASAKSDAAGLLERLSPEEAVALLHQLLDKHPELRSEAEQVATKLVSSFSIEDIAEDVHYRVTSIAG
jgi:phosphoglucomutase